MNKMDFRIERWKNNYAPNPAMLRFLMEREGFAVIQCGGRNEAVFIKCKDAENQSRWVVSGSLEVTVDNIGTYGFRSRRPGFFACRKLSFGARRRRRGNCLFGRQKGKIVLRKQKQKDFQTSLAVNL